MPFTCKCQKIHKVNDRTLYLRKFEVCLAFKGGLHILPILKIS